jgi:hypothetical protein
LSNKPEISCLGYFTDGGNCRRLLNFCERIIYKLRMPTYLPGVKALPQLHTHDCPHGRSGLFTTGCRSSFRPDDEEQWLDVSRTSFAKARSLLKPLPAELMDAHDVSAIVNSAKYDGPECIQPVSDDEIISGRQLSVFRQDHEREGALLSMPNEFRRFLLHVIPKGFMPVRHGGGFFGASPLIFSFPAPGPSTTFTS